MSKSPNPTEREEDDEVDVSKDEVRTWMESHADAVKDVLGEMTAVYNEDNAPIPLKFGERSKADADGNWVQVDPTFWDEVDPEVEGPNILRLLDDLLAHEVGHYNWSDLESKADFADCYPGWGKIPGHIANILEDEYDDAKRMRTWYGMRSKRAYRVWLQTNTEAFTPHIGDLEDEVGKTRALLSALHQVALVGTAKGLGDASDDVQEFCAMANPVLERVRTEDSKNVRFRLFHVVMQLFIRYTDDEPMEDYDEDDFAESEGKTISGEPEPSPDAEEPMSGEMSSAMKEMVEEMLKEMMESGEMGVPEEMSTDEDSDGDEADVEADAPSEDGSGEIVIEIGELDVDAPPIDSGSSPDESIEMDASEDAPGSDDEDSGTGEEESESGADEVESDGDVPTPDDGEVESGETESDAPGESDDDGGSGDSESATDGDGGDTDATHDESGESGESSSGEPTFDSTDEHSRKPRTEEIDGGKGAHHIDDDVDEIIKDDSEHAIEERYSVRMDEIDKYDARDASRWASLARRIREYGNDIEQRKRERDSRMNGRDKYLDIKRRAENSGVIRDLEEGFRQLVSRGVPQTAQRGTRVDSRNVVRRAAGDVTTTDLFEEEVVMETGDRCVGLATDISGSMGSAIDDLKIAGGAIAKATDIVGDEFVWEAFTDRHGTGRDRLDLRIVTGPDEEFRWKHTDSFVAARNEPTAAGIRDCSQLMQQTSANQYLMIVITDGVALVTEEGHVRRGDSEPVEQARAAVEETRAQGIDVVGLGIGEMDDRKMEETFGGKNYRLTDVDRLADDIIDLYKSQMNTDAQQR